MEYRFYTSFSVTLFSRPLTSPPPDWTELETGPGYITLPEGHEYGFRIHNIDDRELKTLVGELAGVEPLTYANLSENRKITEKGVETLKGLPRLTYLNLSSCDLTNESMVGLLPLVHLHTLDLSFCNRITGPALKHLKGLPNLKVVNLQGCVKVKHGDISRFQKRGMTITA
jgi:hypothetical protein